MSKKCLDEVTHFHIMHRKLSGECAVKHTFLKERKMNLGKAHLSWQKYFEKETHGSLNSALGCTFVLVGLCFS